MKFILKGKQFLSKTLEQFDIASDTLDLVQEQIPNKLKQPLKVLQCKHLDLESNEKFETYSKNYPNHHISHYLLDKYESSLQSNAKIPLYQLPTSNGDIFIPNFDKQLQKKALLLKEVVDQYDEGYQKVDEPIICIAVIHFHHKRGTQVEYKYPQTCSVKQIENMIVHHAMPDSSHNKMQDCNYFNFQAKLKGKNRMLFGVSYFKQIKVTEQMKAQNNEITRSYMQKSLAVISSIPLFGYLKLNLANTSKAFFADYSNYPLVNAIYEDLNKDIIETWPQMDISQLYIGSDLRTIINMFGVQQFYQIWKAVLYQKRVVIFANSCSSASSFIVSLLTLFPGLSTFGIFSKDISKYMQSLREYALPLRTFSTDNFMSMSFHIQDFHKLSKFQKSSKGSFLIGTTNRLLKEANDYGIEMLINLQSREIQKQKPRVPWQHFSKKQKAFISEIEAVVQTSQSFVTENVESIVRNKFHNFLKSQLVGIMKANQSLLQWINQIREYEVTNRKKPRKEKRKQKETDYAVMEDDEQSEQAPAPRKKSQDFPPLIPHEVTSIPFPGLLLTSSFSYFLQFHNEKIPELMQNKTFPSLLIENYDYCLVLQSKTFINYSWHDNKLSFGRGRPSFFQGKQIKFETEHRPQRRVKYIYIGQIENNIFTKGGYYLDKNEMYEGEYDNGYREGYGKLTNSIHKYIGNFKNNLYEGMGQIVQGKDIYVGEFREGLKHGNGKSQGELNYDGQWVNDRMEGTGVLKKEGKEFIGYFAKGKIDQSKLVTIRYENGSIYKGGVKDYVASGKGYLVNENIAKFGQFKEGQLVCELPQTLLSQNQNKQSDNPYKQTLVINHE